MDDKTPNMRWNGSEWVSSTTSSPNSPEKSEPTWTGGDIRPEDTPSKENKDDGYHEEKSEPEPA